MRSVLITLLTLLTSFLSFASGSQVQTYQLNNGLKILVKEDHRAPVIVSMLWYHVGSADELPGTTGVAHVLEHLMFKGTKAIPKGVFSKTIASLGGQENAFTNTDYTTYFEKLDAAHLETALKLESDRMQHLNIIDDEFYKEMKVIQEERRMRTDNNPQGLEFERFLAAIHLSAPYHHPVIGWMSDLQQMLPDDARNWYSQYYVPNNATLVIVGDVTPKQVYDLANQYFGAIKPKQQILRKDQLEPPHLGSTEVDVHAPAQIPNLMFGYIVPSVKANDTAHPRDPYVLEVIAGILDAGDSGRLNQRLIQTQHLASNAAVSYNLYTRYQTEFIVLLTPAQGKNIEQLNTGALEEIVRLQKEPVPIDELLRVKTQIIAQKTFEKDSIFSQAMELGILDTIGLPEETAQKYIPEIKAVTPDEIMDVAKRYFNNYQMTEVHLLPKKAAH